MQTMHANAVVTIHGKKYVTDIAAYGPAPVVADSQVNDEQLLGLFYGNRAMELLLNGREREAQTWLDVALTHSPDDATLLNNAGVLSLRRGSVASAEAFYLRALVKDPRLTSGFSNLISLYRVTGDLAQADQWQRRAATVLRKDPYHQFSLGRQSEESGDYANAIDLYRKAIRLNDDEPLFHFGLARVHHQLGQFALARLELSRARKLSGENDQPPYQGKLDATLMRIH